MLQTHQISLGRFQCLAINDGLTQGTADFLFLNAPENERQQALAESGLVDDQLPATRTCLYVDTGTNRVLIDTGMGLKNGGWLLESLERIGIDLKAIDTVILSHGHADHIGGVTDVKEAITFRNARFFMQRSEWDYWANEAIEHSGETWAITFAHRKLKPLADRIELIEKDIEIIPGIQAIFAPGHTAGHMVLELISEDQCLLFAADTFLHPIHIEHPDWVSQMDQNPKQTIATRCTVLERAAVSQALVLAFHFMPFPSLGHIRRKAQGWLWEGTNDPNK